MGVGKCASGIGQLGIFSCEQVLRRCEWWYNDKPGRQYSVLRRRRTVQEAKKRTLKRFWHTSFLPPPGLLSALSAGLLGCIQRTVHDSAI